LRDPRHPLTISRTASSSAVQAGLADGRRPKAEGSSLAAVSCLPSPVSRPHARAGSAAVPAAVPGASSPAVQTGLADGRRPTTDGFSLAAPSAVKNIIIVFTMALAVLLVGCREDMQNQPRINPLRISDFYLDQRSARPLIAGTIARGDLRNDTYFYTGLIGKDPGNEMPFPATREVLERGRGRFNIFCAPCHSELGDGNGIVVQRGYQRPPSYHGDRLRNAPLGHFYDVISNGFGAMPDYAAQVPPYDRWAIAAYIRALQLSQNAPASLVPAGTQLPPAAAPGAMQYDPLEARPRGSEAEEKLEKK